MISSIHPFMNIALTPQKCLDEERFNMPELHRPRGRGVRAFSLDDLLGVIPEPPVYVKIAATAATLKVEKQQLQAALENEVRALERATDLRAISRKVACERRVIRSISPVPATRCRGLPEAA